MTHQAQRKQGIGKDLGVRIWGTLGEIDPLNKVPVKRAISRLKKGLLYGVSLGLGFRV